MIDRNLKLLQSEFDELKTNSIHGFSLQQGVSLSEGGQCILLTQSKAKLKFSVYDEDHDYEVWIGIKEKLEMNCDCNNKLICKHKIAGLTQSIELLKRDKIFESISGYRYTRSGMINRVIKERLEKAIRADYKIKFADNKHGEHGVLNEKGKEYKITLRDFGLETGYCSCPDYNTNKLGTCKHLMFVFNQVKNNLTLLENKTETFPFVEIYLNPRNNYQISWYYPGRIEPIEISELIFAHFGNSIHLPDDKVISFLGFLQNAPKHKKILIRKEVYEKVENAYNKNMLDQIKTSVGIDFGLLNRNIPDYQKEGVEFATFREGVILADQPGLKNRIQSVVTAIMKKELIGFKSCLIISRFATISYWEKIIVEYSGYKPVFVGGSLKEREHSYKNGVDLFRIVDYESITQDSELLPNLSFDFLILDEAELIRKFENKPSTLIKSIKRKHTLAISGIRLERKLSDLYSIVSFVDTKFLAPLWEFSYNYYYFDPNSKNKISGYYNLNKLNERLKRILLSRKRNQIANQLPSVSHETCYVKMHPEQLNIQLKLVEKALRILEDKHNEAFDYLKLSEVLEQMRDICNPTNLFENELNDSPKAVELHQLLTDKIDYVENNENVIIFSSNTKTQALIGEMLKEQKIEYAELLKTDNKAVFEKRLNKHNSGAQNGILLVTDHLSGFGEGYSANTIINFDVPSNLSAYRKRAKFVDYSSTKYKNILVLDLIAHSSIEKLMYSEYSLGTDVFDDIGILKSNILDYLLSINNYSSTENVKSQYNTETGSLYRFENHMLDEIIAEGSADDEKTDKISYDDKSVEMVLNKGVEYMTSLFKSSSGRQISNIDRVINIDKDTGEVIIKFKVE